MEYMLYMEYIEYMEYLENLEYMEYMDYMEYLGDEPGRLPEGAAAQRAAEQQPGPHPRLAAASEGLCLCIHRKVGAAY